MLAVSRRILLKWMTIPTTRHWRRTRATGTRIWNRWTSSRRGHVAMVMSISPTGSIVRWIVPNWGTSAILVVMDPTFTTEIIRRFFSHRELFLSAVCQVGVLPFKRRSPIPGQMVDLPFAGFLTPPHFLWSPPEVQNSVYGLSPDTSKHHPGSFDINPASWEENR